MQRVSESLKQLWRIGRAPHIAARLAANARAWAELPANLRSTNQVLGQQQAGCAATHNVLERCNFSCTACYLASTGNKVPPLPFDEVKAQLDTIRAHLGPQGNAQITAGEVTLLPVDELTRIVRYAVDIGLSPMVMTHGDTFRDDDTYLETLVRDGGLRKVGIHIDTTQHGRRGMAGSETEQDIHWIRDELAEIIRRTRTRTGLPLAAAHTVTVTEENLDQVPDIMEWMLANADAFRMVSFQPTAGVGRTRASPLADRGRGPLWQQICAGAGKQLHPQPMLFGHPACTQVGLYFVVDYGRSQQLVEVTREGAAVDAAFFDSLMTGSFAGFNTNGLSKPQVVANLLGRIAEDPRLLLGALGYCLYRAGTERRWLPHLIHTIASGGEWAIHPFVIVVHHFMDADELDTPDGRERLDTCAFRVAVAGRMVPMCEMNGTDLRAQLNRDVTQRFGPIRAVSA